MEVGWNQVVPEVPEERRRSAPQSCFLTNLCTSFVTNESWAPILPPVGLRRPNRAICSFLHCKPRKNGGPRLLSFHLITWNEECCSMTVAGITRGLAAFLFFVLFMFLLIIPLCTDAFHCLITDVSDFVSTVPTPPAVAVSIMCGEMGHWDGAKLGRGPHLSALQNCIAAMPNNPCRWGEPRGSGLAARQRSGDACSQQEGCSLWGSEGRNHPRDPRCHPCSQVVLGAPSMLSGFQ